MATPKFDKMCIEFVKRIPDQMEDPLFTPGSGPLPRSFLLSDTVIIDYINRGLQKFFAAHWLASQGNVQAIINVFNELQAISNEETLSAEGEFVIEDPYMDLKKIIGAFLNLYEPGGTQMESRVFVKPKDESLYTQFVAGKYRSYQATEKDPAIIQVGSKLAVFPPDVSDKFIFHYIKQPLDPETGLVLIQDGDHDSPYSEQWHKDIVDVAYGMYLEETVQTTQ